MKKGVIPERAITIGYNGPTNEMWLQKESWKIQSKTCDKSFTQREERTCGYHNNKSIYGLM